MPLVIAIQIVMEFSNLVCIIQDSDFDKYKRIVKVLWRDFQGQNNNQIIGARLPLACFSPIAFSYYNSNYHGVFKSSTIEDSDFNKCKEHWRAF